MSLCSFADLVLWAAVIWLFYQILVLHWQYPGWPK